MSSSSTDSSMSERRLTSMHSCRLCACRADDARPPHRRPLAARLLHDRDEMVAVCALHRIGEPVQKCGDVAAMGLGLVFAAVSDWSVLRQLERITSRDERSRSYSTRWLPSSTLWCRGRV